jgi:hypothetical protein
VKVPQNQTDINFDHPGCRTAEQRANRRIMFVPMDALNPNTQRPIGRQPTSALGCLFLRGRRYHEESPG